MSWSGSHALIWDSEHLRIAADAAGIALWSWNVETNEIAMDQRAHDLWGIPQEGRLTFEDLSARLHPADIDRVRTTLTATRATLGPYDIDFRIVHGDDVRWISARGQGANHCTIGRIMFGVFLDVTPRRQAEEAREMLAAEMDHRIKNLFAIASALAAISARKAATTTEMARDLMQRLRALGNAHDLVRSRDGQLGQKTVLLGDLLAVLLAPYAEQGTGARRIRVSVPEVPVGEASATTLALIVYELATNSVKYGALSVASGALALSCAEHNGDVVVVWTERGGPAVAASPGPAGFGSKLVFKSVFGQLGGSIAYDWRTEGAVITLRMSKARLAA